MIKYRKFCLVMLLILFHLMNHVTFSQSIIDSLEYVLTKVYKDTSYASLPPVLDMLAEEYRYKNPVKSLEYANELKDIASELNDLEFCSRAYRHIGNTYCDLGIYYLAYENYYSALEIYKNLDNQVEIANVFNAIGNINLSQGLNDLALDHFNKALSGINQKNIKLFDKQYKEALANTYNNIAWVYFKNNEIDTVRFLMEKALEIRKQNGDVSKIGYSLLNIGRVEMNYDFMKAIDLYDQALSLFELAENKDDIALCYKHIGDAYQKLQKYEKALQNYQEAMEVFLNEGNRFQVINLHTVICRMYMDDGKLDEAENMANRVLDLATKSNFLIQQRDIYKLLSEIYTQKKDYRMAMENYKQYALLLDSIYSRQVIQTLTRIEVLNETEIREREIAIQKLSLSRKNLMLIAMVSVIFSLGVVVYILIRRHNFIQNTSKLIREQQHKIYTQQKMIMEQNEENLKKELAFKNQEVTYKTMNLLHSNEYYSRLVQDLTEANQENHNRDIDVIIRSLKVKMKAESSEKTWQEFEILFMQLHQDFFTRLNSEYPDLTTNEKRLCSFLRLNMTTKDISTITGQTIRSIEIARTRLRKKLNLKQEENLVGFILTL